MNLKSIYTTAVAFIAVSAMVCAQTPFVGDWTGELNVMGTKLKLVFHISEAEGGNRLAALLDVPEQGAKDLPAKVVNSAADSLIIEVAMIGAKFSGKIDNDVIIGGFSQHGYTFPMTLKKGVDQPLRPQNPQPPFPYTTKDVTFFNQKAGATLAGTLTYPAGYDSKKREKTPVAVMVTGSGQQNRDEELFGHRPFAVIADYLARNGIATLRYDDRGFGESKGGLTADVTTLDFADDACVAVDYLRKSGEFGKVGIIGHSEGGMIAFILGSRKNVDFVVSLAGTGVKGEDVLMSQIRRKCEIAMDGMPKSQIEKLAKTTYDKQLEAMTPWLRFFLDYDPVDDIRATNCPVLALNGSLDSQVLPSLNLPVIKANLSDNPLTEVREMEGLNHLFQHCKTGGGEEYFNIEETFAPEALDAIVNFIKRINK